MVSQKDIEKMYSEILSLSKDYDSLFEIKETTGGWTQEIFKKNEIEKYWQLREKLESEISDWMQFIRKSINSLSENEKKFTERTGIEPSTGEEYSIIIYYNKNFGALMDFFYKIQRATEDVVLRKIQRKQTIYSDLRELRGDVLSFKKTIELFIPENMITIEKQVEIIFKLRDLGMADEALMLEEIDSDNDVIKKCLKARTALENIVKKYCETKHIKIQKGFYNNLDNAIKNGLTEEKKRKAIAGHYTFISKIIHGEIKPDIKDIQYAINGVMNIIGSII